MWREVMFLPESVDKNTIQVWRSPNFVSHTPGRRGWTDYILEGQGQWGGMRSTDPL